MSTDRCVGTIKRRLDKRFKSVDKKASIFPININGLGWETLAQRRLIAGTCALFKRYTVGRAWKAIRDRFLKPCYLSRDDHNRKIRNREQRTDVGKYSIVNSIIKSWNQLSAGLLVTFPCKLNMFKKEG